MYLYSVPAVSQEEFVHMIISARRRIGLDVARGYVLSEAPLSGHFLIEGVEDEAAELCRGRPPLPVVSHYPPGGRGGPRVGAAMAPHGIIWLEPLGFLHKGREWRVAASCRARPPIAGWERVTVDAVHQMLQILSSYYWRFWPRGIRVDPRGTGAWTAATALLERGRMPADAAPPLRGVEADKKGFLKVADARALVEDVRGAASADELMHVLVAGASAAGKTTLVKSIIRLRRHVVIDITPKYEYAGDADGAVVEGSIDFSSFTAEERVQLLTLAFAATLGKEDSAFSPVQFGVLRRLGSVHLTRLLSAVAALDVPQLTKQVMIEKLSSLCVSIDDEYNCTPHALLLKSAEVKPPAVVKITAQDQFLQAVLVHGILMRLLREPQPEPTFVVLDEYHRVAAKVENIEDPAERLIRMGRHGNWHVIIATQSPLELKQSIISITPTQVYFQLHGDAARLAASVLNVDAAVVSTQGPGQWLAVVRTAPGKPAWPRRSP
jgi:energy-coupling factor transporter ATP-binding protein EcfA2